MVKGLVLPYLLLEALRQEVGASIPLLIGSNRDEAHLYTSEDPHLAHPNHAGLTAYFGTNSDAVYADSQRAGERRSSDEAWFSTLTDYLYGLATQYHIADTHRRVIGSILLGQQFTRPEYFHGRPSVGGYDASNSGGSKALGPIVEHLHLFRGG